MQENGNISESPEICPSVGRAYQAQRGRQRIYGRTLYLGSLKSDVYFCIYEKDYEQYVKLGTPLEEADIINRFEYTA